MSETEDHVKQAYTRTIPTNRTAEDGEITEPNDALKREMSSGRETARDHIDEDVQPAEGICFSPGPDPPDIQPGVGGLPATSSRSASRSEDRFTGLLTVCTECELHFGEQQAEWSACPICGDETLTTVEAAAFVCDGGECPVCGDTFEVFEDIDAGESIEGVRICVIEKDGNEQVGDAIIHLPEEGD